MAEEPEGPPFPNPPSHINPTEIHDRRDQLLQTGYQLVNTKPDEIISSILQTIQVNGTHRTLNQFYVHYLLQECLLGDSIQSDNISRQLGSKISDEKDPGLPPRLLQLGIGLTLRVKSETTEPQPFEKIASDLLRLMNWYHLQSGDILTVDRNLANPYFGLVWRELTTLRHANGYQMMEKGY